MILEFGFRPLFVDDWRIRIRSSESSKKAKTWSYVHAKFQMKFIYGGSLTYFIIS